MSTHQGVRPRPAVRHLAVALAGALALLCLLLGLALGAAPAQAHAVLLETSPADGETLTEAPEEITLTFNEPVRVSEGAVRLIDAAGQENELPARSVDTQVVATPPEGLAAGGYLVAWEVVSADGHPISGAFGFVVEASTNDSATSTPAPGSPGEESQGGSSPGAAVPLPPQAPTVATPSSVPRDVAQAAQYLGALATTGLVVMSVLVLPREHTASVRRRLTTGAGLAASVGVLGSLALIPLTGAYLSGEGVGAVLAARSWVDGVQGGLGRSVLLVIGGLLLAVGALVARGRRVARGGGATRTGVLGLTGIGLALVALVLIGHTRTFGPEALVVASDLVHLVTGGVWFGGLIALVLVLSTGAAPAAEKAAAVSRFSGIAAGLVALLGATGLFLGWRIVGSWSALVSTTYGITLLVKLGLVGVAVAIAAYNRFGLLPRVRAGGGPRPLLRAVRLEGLVLVLAVLATGYLVGQDPTPPPAATAAPTGAAPAEGGEDQAGQAVPLGPDGTAGAVTVRLDPGTAGENTLQIELVDPEGEPLTPQAEPQVSLSLPATDLGPLPAEVTEEGAGRWSATADLPLAGTWVVEVRARTSTFEEPAARIEVEVGP